MHNQQQPKGKVNLRDERTRTGPMEVTEADRQTRGQTPGVERSRRRGPDRENVNRRKGRARAASVRGNAKPSIHQGAPGRVGGHGPEGVMLTLRERPRESAGEVSRGRSSKEARGRSIRAERRAEGNKVKLYGTLRTGRPARQWNKTTRATSPKTNPNGPRVNTLQAARREVTRIRA
jgi:hypothetical protein